MRARQLRKIWEVVYLLLLAGGCYYCYDKFGDDGNVLSFPMSILLLLIYALGIAVVFLMISGKLQTYEIVYQKPKVRIGFLPQNYFVKKTLGLHNSRYDRKVDVGEENDHVGIASSISAFCASKGSTANKFLATFATLIFGIILTNINNFKETNEKIQLLMTAVGILFIGLAESKYHDWAWTHILGLVILVIGMVWHLFEFFTPTDAIIVIIAYVIFMIINNAPKKWRKKIWFAIIIIALEFFTLFFPATKIFLRYI